MAALQAMACGEDGRALLAPILCRERTALLSEIITNAFVETVIKLGPLVADMEIADPTGGTDTPMSVELVTPAGFSTSRHTVVRRALEQTIALTALNAWCRASQGNDKSAATLADSFATVAAGWYDTLLTTLTPTAYPTVRR